MNNVKRIFLVVQGECSENPTRKSSNFLLTTDDPVSIKSLKSFVSSPIFSLSEEGNPLPSIDTSKLTITFFIVPKLYPTLNELPLNFEETNSVWFSSGLANIIVIENDEQLISKKIEKFLLAEDNCIGSEIWTIDSKRIEFSEPTFYNPKFDGQKHCNLTLPTDIPLYLEFCISEYILSANKLLNLADKFTPHYFEKYQNTLLASNLFVQDLCFLAGDKNFNPSDSLLSALSANDIDDAYEKMTQPSFSRQREQLLNIKHAIMVQFNSSISYLLSQAYAGTLPLLESKAVINRYSLLGIAGGVSALFELIIQLEEAFFKVPFENINDTIYSTANDIIPEWYGILTEPSTFDSSLWEDNPFYKSVMKIKTSEVPIGVNCFYHRFAFFSGRLGFRENDFAATAAIQVLADGHSLKWNIINYTHEVIHNHVRIILRQLLLPIENISTKTYDLWLSNYRDLLKSAIINKSQKRNITYKQYFTLVILNFTVWSDYYGSLNRPSNSALIKDIRTGPREAPVQLLTFDEIKENIHHTYRDITEIFVHVFDFVYIYKKRRNSYLLSIWLSWSHLPSVTINLRQYILRSLIVICINEKGKNQKERFEKGIAEFTDILNFIRQNLKDELIVESILNVLSDENEIKDLQYRFYNCILIGDLISNFLIADLASLLDNSDDNRLGINAKDEKGNLISYAINTGTFNGKEIKSKVRFLLDQLEREISRIGEKLDNATKERYSAWLVLSLSTKTE